MCVLHKCDNPKCINVDHLFLGTKKDNHNDMVLKGRGKTGSMNGQSKLTEKDAQEIKIKIALGESNSSIANEYKVTGATIWSIKKGRTWAHA